MDTKRFLLFFLKLRLTAIPVTYLMTFSGCGKRDTRTKTGFVLSTLFSDNVFLCNVSVVCKATNALCFRSVPTKLAKAPLRILTLMFFFSKLTFGLDLMPFRL